MLHVSQLNAVLWNINWVHINEIHALGRILYDIVQVVEV